MAWRYGLNPRYCWKEQSFTNVCRGARIFGVLCILPSVNLRRGLGKKTLLIFAVTVENCP